MKKQVHQHLTQMKREKILLDRLKEQASSNNNKIKLKDIRKSKEAVVEGLVKHSIIIKTSIQITCFLKIDTVTKITER